MSDAFTCGGNAQLQSDSDAVQEWPRDFDVRAQYAEQKELLEQTDDKPAIRFDGTDRDE